MCCVGDVSIKYALDALLGAALVDILAEVLFVAEVDVGRELKLCVLAIGQ